METDILYAYVSINPRKWFKLGYRGITLQQYIHVLIWPEICNPTTPSWNFPPDIKQQFRPQHWRVQCCQQESQDVIHSWQKVPTKGAYYFLRHCVMPPAQKKIWWGYGDILCHSLTEPKITLNAHLAFNHESFIELKSGHKVFISILLKTLLATQGMHRPQLLQFLEPNSSVVVTIPTL